MKLAELLEQKVDNISTSVSRFRSIFAIQALFVQATRFFLEISPLKSRHVNSMGRLSCRLHLNPNQMATSSTMPLPQSQPPHNPEVDAVPIHLLHVHGETRNE